MHRGEIMSQTSFRMNKSLIKHPIWKREAVFDLAAANLANVLVGNW